MTYSNWSIRMKMALSVGVAEVPNGLFEALRKGLSNLCCFEKFGSFTPDGAGKQNIIASFWQSYRDSHNIRPLPVSHFSGHRAAMAIKDSKDQWLSAGQNMIARQWYFFSESHSASEACAQCCKDLRQPALAPLNAWDQKCIGYASAEARDCDQWDSNDSFWQDRFEQFELNEKKNKIK